METIKREYAYSISEAEAITGINRKRIERQCKKDKVTKRGRNYELDGGWLIDTFKLNVVKVNDTIDKKDNMSYTKVAETNLSGTNKQKDNQNKLIDYLEKGGYDIDDIKKLTGSKWTKNEHKITTQSPPPTPEPETEDQLRKKEYSQENLDKQFGKGIEHLTVMKKIKDDTPMNQVGFGTRLNHLNNIENMYPTGIQNSEPIVESTVSITRPDKDGVLRTTTKNVTTDFDKLAMRERIYNKL
tara:strand:+ start:2944 stop:3669 length:726 start_codon:yes stop_codon:yes gene_type:complete